MRSLYIFIAMLSLLCGGPVFAGTPLKGVWKFSGVVYRGQEMPLPNPKLNMTWTFFENNTARLYWDREGEIGFCERFSTYQLVDNFLDESVFAVNPNNAFECARDLDMQVGRKTKTKIELQETRTLLFFQLGDEEIVYILKKIDL